MFKPVQNRSPLLLLPIVLFYLGCGQSSESRPALGAKIVQGSMRSESEVPQVVRVIVTKEDSAYSLCSGVVVGKRSILTAAHCVTKALQVSVFTDHALKVEQIVPHPGFRIDLLNRALFDDLAILKLAQDLTIAPFPILTTVEPAHGAVLSIFGFGSDGSGGLGTLREGLISVAAVTPSHLFSVFQGKSSNTCAGDSGGPALYALDTLEPESHIYGVVGLVSSGTKRDCSLGDTTLFTNLHNEELLQFLIAHIEDIDLI